MASTRAHRPHEILAAALAAALASVMTAALLGAIAGSASAASAAPARPGTGPGGAQAGGVSVGSGTAATGSGRSRSAGTSAAHPPSAHVTSVRITSATCMPQTRCSANPHQVSVHGTLLGVAAIAVLSNGLVHARQPREVAGLLTGVLLILALGISTLPKLLATLRARRQALPENIQSTTAGKAGRMKI